jgi:hypothetical protein
MSDFMVRPACSRDFTMIAPENKKYVRAIDRPAALRSSRPVSAEPMADIDLN